MIHNLIKTEIEQLIYPVGNYINENKPLILKLIEEFKKIEEFNGVPLNLICRGSSGAIVAAMFAMVLENDCTIVHVKKDGEKSHSEKTPLNPMGKNIIVDDFICTGETIIEIYNSFKDDKMLIDCICVTGRMQHFDFEVKHFIYSY